MNGNVVVLAGGTGGAKFVRGVARCVPPERLTIVANTGDDITMHGLRISPDMDINMYTLAGLVDPARGWGIAEDTFNCVEQLRRYGQDGWFNLGDRDLATHMVRTQLLAKGKPPSAVAQILAKRLGVRQRILPMTDQPVETHVQLADGRLMHFQEYLIKCGAPETVQTVMFQNIGTALPAAGVLRAIEEADVILLAPSSPVVSIGAILSVSGIFEAIEESGARGAAVSPLMSRVPISGPSAQLMRAFGIQCSNRGLCDAYGALVELLVIHNTDKGDAAVIEEQGLRALVTDTLMPDADASHRLAREVLDALDYAVADVKPPPPRTFSAPVPGTSAHSVPRTEGAEPAELATPEAEPADPKVIWQRVPPEQAQRLPDAAPGTEA